MCSVSAVIDNWRDGWGDKYIAPYVYPDTQPLIDKVERAQLKKEIAEFREILRRAKKWDAEHQAEPCNETPAKIEALREIVKALGLEEEVDIVLKELEETDDDDIDTPVTLNGGVTWHYEPNANTHTLGGFGGSTSGTTSGNG